MTEQESIKSLEYTKRNCGMPEQGNRWQANRETIAIDNAIDALEKRIGIEPTGIDMCTCPNCGTYNEVVKKRRNTVNKDVVFCWHCGQAMTINRDDV